LERLSSDGNFDVSSMFSILRDDDSGICCTGHSVSVGSQVSVLFPRGSLSPHVHWFTATPNPARSIFKPFVFMKEASVGDNVTSLDFGESDPVRKKPRFQSTVDRRHKLYALHEGIPPIGGTPNSEVMKAMQDLEKKLLEDLMKKLEIYAVDKNSSEFSSVFKEAVEEEMKVCLQK